MSIIKEITSYLLTSGPQVVLCLFYALVMGKSKNLKFKNFENKLHNYLKRPLQNINTNGIYDEENTSTLSNEAQDLLVQMLEKKNEKRIKINEIMKKNWINVITKLD